MMDLFGMITLVLGNTILKTTLRRLIIVPGGLITSPGVVLVVMVLVSVVLGVGF